MAKKSTSLITTGLLLPIVAGIVVELVTDISVVGPIWLAITAIGAFFAQPVTLPLWGAVLLALSGLAVVRVVALILEARSEVSADYLAYTSDELLGLRWRWNYEGGKPKNLIPFCPRCDYQPVLREDYGHPTLHTEVNCDNCGFSKEFDFPPSEVQDRTRRHVQRKVRTGEYKSAVPQQST